VATQPYVRPPTIHDVARVAKLSKSTVSNVIRNAVGVHPATRERVQAAIVELGYQTNIVARQLVQQRTSILGMVVGDLDNPFHAEMAKLIEGQAAAQGYQVMFCNARTERDPDLNGIQRMLEHRVAGLLFLSCRSAAERARHLISGRVPAVFVACNAGWGDVVSVDERAGAMAATALLISAGRSPPLRPAAGLCRGDDARRAGTENDVHRPGRQDGRDRRRRHAACGCAAR
jgi:LacI family transcriptional regulator